MLEGGGVLLARQLLTGAVYPQHQDSAADHYVSVRCSNPDAAFKKTVTPVAGMHGGFRAAQGMATFVLEGTTLRAGETITVVYGDKTGGARGIRIQYTPTDELLFPIYVDLEGKGNYLTPKWPGKVVIGEGVQSVHLPVRRWPYSRIQQSGLGPQGSCTSDLLGRNPRSHRFLGGTGLRGEFFQIWSRRIPPRFLVPVRARHLA